MTTRKLMTLTFGVASISFLAGIAAADDLKAEAGADSRSRSDVQLEAAALRGMSVDSQTAVTDDAEGALELGTDEASLSAETDSETRAAGGSDLSAPSVAPAPPAAHARSGHDGEADAAANAKPGQSAGSVAAKGRSYARKATNGGRQAANATGDRVLHKAHHTGSGLNGAIRENVDQALDHPLAGRFDAESEVDVQSELDAGLDDALQSDADLAVHNEIEAEVEADVTDVIKSEIDGEVESVIEAEVETEVTDAIESELESEVESEIETEVADAVEDEVESEVTSAVESEIDGEIRDSISAETEAEVVGEVLGGVAGI